MIKQNTYVLFVLRYQDDKSVSAADTWLSFDVYGDYVRFFSANGKLFVCSDRDGVMSARHENNKAESSQLFTVKTVMQTKPVRVLRLITQMGCCWLYALLGVTLIAPLCVYVCCSIRTFVYMCLDTHVCIRKWRL